MWRLSYSLSIAGLLIIKVDIMKMKKIIWAILRKVSFVSLPCLTLDEIYRSVKIIRCQDCSVLHTSAKLFAGLCLFLAYVCQLVSFACFCRCETVRQFNKNSHLSPKILQAKSKWSSSAEEWQTKWYIILTWW